MQDFGLGEFLRNILVFAWVTGLRPQKSAVPGGVFVTPCDFVIPGLVGFGSEGLLMGEFRKCWEYRVAPPKSAVLNGVSVSEGDFAIPRLVVFGS